MKCNTRDARHLVLGTPQFRLFSVRVHFLLLLLISVCFFLLIRFPQHKHAPTQTAAMRHTQHNTRAKNKCPHSRCQKGHPYTPLRFGKRRPKKKKKKKKKRVLYFSAVNVQAATPVSSVYRRALAYRTIQYPLNQNKPNFAGDTLKTRSPPRQSPVKFVTQIFITMMEPLVRITDE
ncbi:hypothetical protein BC938DRAFT_480910 [Jimgerdemannia flammicorona]|uniref:Uncharacterized protein n=1 Tax=Jimgerdemannia flammicorona TaxID=994334 RepID=A0A433QHI1_9FUNG|nr:hypothetical protein BC938DRAFT_480910 [Jimgerdemannia flammicorona]